MDGAAVVGSSRKGRLTDDHPCADVTELGFLAVVVLEPVGLVVDRFDWL